VESLADLGYEVNAAAADGYEIPQVVGYLLRAAGAGAVDLEDDELSVPPVLR
jgi:hypothetical protein